MTLIIFPDKDLVVYSGDPALVTALFTTGVKRGDIPVTFNVRIFESEEVRAGSVVLMVLYVSSAAGGVQRLLSAGLCCLPEHAG